MLAMSVTRAIGPPKYAPRVVDTTSTPNPKDIRSVKTVRNSDFECQRCRCYSRPWTSQATSPSNVCSN